MNSVGNTHESHSAQHDDISQITDHDNMTDGENVDSYRTESSYTADTDLVQKLRSNVQSIFADAVAKSEQTLKLCYERLDQDFEFLEQVLFEGLELTNNIETDHEAQANHKRELETLVNSLRYEI